jgi:hypothetical protein
MTVSPPGGLPGGTYHETTMSDPTSRPPDMQRILGALAATRIGSGAIDGPLRIVSSVADEGGGTTYQVTASALVLVDPDTPALAGISIPVPVDATVTVDRHGAVGGVSMTPVDADTIREARAFARTLIETGAVRGLGLQSAAGGPAAGSPARQTHEIATGPDGARVIRRMGFASHGS